MSFFLHHELMGNKPYIRWKSALFLAL